MRHIICPLHKTQNVQKVSEKFTWKVFNAHVYTTQFIFDLRTFVANSALSDFRAFWGGPFGQNLVGGGTKTF